MSDMILNIVSELLVYKNKKRSNKDVKWNLYMSKLNSESSIKQTLNKVPMQEIFVNWKCLRQTLVYSKNKMCPKEVWFRQVSVMVLMEN
jgi:hypothetical protein